VSLRRKDRRSFFCSGVTISEVEVLLSAIDRRVSDFLVDEGVHIVSQASTHKQEDEYDLREKVETKENEEKVRES